MISITINSLLFSKVKTPLNIFCNIIFKKYVKIHNMICYNIKTTNIVIIQIY